MAKDSTKIGIISAPLNQANKYPYFNLINIISSISDDTKYSIVGSDDLFTEDKIKGSSFHILHNPGKKFFSRILGYLTVQIKISILIFRQFGDCDKIIFYLGDSLLLPILIAKIMNKKTYLLLGGYQEKAVTISKDSLLQYLNILKRVNLVLTNYIIVYSKNIIPEWNLESHRNKVIIAHKHVIDLDLFFPKMNISDRYYSFGFIGVFAEQKGILSFLDTIPKLIQQYPNLKIFIGGNGLLLEDVEKYLLSNKLDNNVLLSKWIPHQDLPDVLNSIKLLVIPSYSEGLPNIMLEAMACGTPVLATPVGAIPDIINDGINGYLLKDNKGETIAQSLIDSLNDPNFDKVSFNANKTIQKQFSFEQTVNIFSSALNQE